MLHLRKSQRSRFFARTNHLLSSTQSTNLSKSYLQRILEFSCGACYSWHRLQQAIGLREIRSPSIQRCNHADRNATHFLEATWCVFRGRWEKRRRKRGKSSHRWLFRWLRFASRTMCVPYTFDRIVVATNRHCVTAPRCSNNAYNIRARASASAALQTADVILLWSAAAISRWQHSLFLSPSLCTWLPRRAIYRANTRDAHAGIYTGCSSFLPNRG